MEIAVPLLAMLAFAVAYLPWRLRMGRRATVVSVMWGMFVGLVVVGIASNQSKPLASIVLVLLFIVLPSAVLVRVVLVRNLRQLRRMRSAYGGEREPTWLERYLEERTPGVRAGRRMQSMAHGEGRTHKRLI